MICCDTQEVMSSTQDEANKMCAMVHKSTLKNMKRIKDLEAPLVK